MPLLVSTSASAQTSSQHVLLTACNDTSAPIWVAVGSFSSQGWWKIESGACRYVGSFQTYGVGFNVYAQASDGINWSGSTYEDDWYCVDVNNAFSLSDGFRNDSSGDCPSGYTLKHFRFIHTPDGYGKDQDFSYTYRFHM
ncbi:MAG TPA: DUF1036 domain-containing protein [Candidatus Rubrimentiphilum sp.]|nr:DUF1036 domain-containing protein [Candidatus Rubrimentiphilum sp.]